MRHIGIADNFFRQGLGFAVHFGGHDEGAHLMDSLLVVALFPKKIGSKLTTTFFMVFMAINVTYIVKPSCQ